VMTFVIVFNHALVDMVDRGWIRSGAVQDGWIGFLVSKLLISLAILIPLILALCILLSHRVAGPMYRFRLFLQDVRDGKQPAACRIRTADEFQDFCTLLNEATAPLRAEASDREVDLPVHADEREAERLAS
jgi:hypothetical protein